MPVLILAPMCTWCCARPHTPDRGTDTPPDVAVGPTRGRGVARWAGGRTVCARPPGRASDVAARHLPVLAGQRCVGVLTEPAVVRALTDPAPPVGPAPLVGQLCRSAPVLGPDDRRSAAASAMSDSGVDAVLVVERGRLLGIVTATDLVRSLVPATGQDVTSDRRAEPAARRVRGLAGRAQLTAVLHEAGARQRSVEGYPAELTIWTRRYAAGRDGIPAELRTRAPATTGLRSLPPGQLRVRDRPQLVLRFGRPTGDAREVAATPGRPLSWVLLGGGRIGP